MASKQNTPDESAEQPDSAWVTVSLDWWAVIVALVLVLLVWIGIFQSIPW